MTVYEVRETLEERPPLRVSRGRRDDGTAVVLKRLASDANLRARDRFRHEYAVLSGLDVPGVITPFGLDETDDGLQLVFEDIGGESLERAFAPNTKLALERFLDLAVGLAGTLAGLHRRRIAHEAINPAHIVLNAESGEFRLIGFGSADQLPQRQVAPQSPAAIEGSLAYIAPEQTGHMNRCVDYRTDFYSLGATFYRLLVGRPPFEADDVLGLVHQHIAAMPTPPHELDSTIPPALSAIVMKMLSKMAEDRYQSGIGLKADLERCRVGLAANAQLDFEPGQEDYSDRLQLPQKLYGRETESELLLAAFERTRTGGRELLLVTGFAGVGKTSLVHETLRFIGGNRGRFVEGKFDQLQRGVPYFGWIQAFSGFVRYLPMEGEAQLARWRRVITAAVGNIGRVLTDVIPDLEQIIGRQPEVPALAGVEAQNRFNYAFLELIKAIATPRHPLVIFLDDLQWVDSASLRLLHTLLTHPSVANLLVIGAYRDNEVDVLHPLAASLQQLRREKAAVESMAIGDLSEKTVNELIADTLRCPQGQTLPLTRLVFARTGGNPFFLLQTLKALTDAQALAFDFENRRWSWEIAAIESMGFADNVVTLMLEGIRKLPQETQHLLSLAASIGFRFDLRNLSAVDGHPEENALDELQPALSGGFVLVDGEQYQFAHDRVREAAYSLVPIAQRPAQHLRIGRLLLAHTPDNALADNIFDIVGHLNQGAALLTQTAERVQLAELNFLAGRRAKTATALVLAIDHFAAGMAALGPAAWETHHSLAFSLHVELAESEYVVGNFARSEELLKDALDHARTLLDRALVYRMYQRLYQQSGRWPEAVSAALKGLELFGVSFPKGDEEIRLATVAEKMRIEANLRGRRIAELADVPFTDDAEAKVLIGLLAESITQFFITRPVLWHLIVLRCVNLCLEKGHVDESPYIYSSYCKMLVALYNDIDSAFEFSQLSLKLNERLTNAGFMKGLSPFFHASVVSIWRQHFKTNLPLLDQAFQTFIDSGDFIWAGYLTYNAVWLHLENGAPLEHVVETARRYAAFNQRNHNDIIYIVDRLEEQFALCLQGKTRTLTEFDDDAFDEAASVAAIERVSFGIGICYYRIMKQIAAFIAGNFDEALQWAGRVVPVLNSVSSMAIWGTYHFYYALTLTALYQEASAQRQLEFRGVLADVVERMKFWAQNCPDNFANRYALVRAEVARIEARDQDAMGFYEQAIASARENRFVQNEALAYEVAAAFYQRRGYEKFFRTYVAEAAACYARWGAAGKVRQLERRHAWLAASKPPEAVTLPERLDALSLAKAQQAISGEILMDRLARTLLRIVMENAGAQKGWLSVEGGGKLLAKMQKSGNDESRIVFDSSPSDASIPEAMFNFVRHRRETVILADASADAGGFLVDEYLRRERPRSVLCMAIQRQARLLAVLYLENNLAANVFAAERLELIKALASQSAISMENAGLYESLRQSEQKFRAIFDQTFQFIGVLTVDGILLQANQTALRFAKVGEESVVGKPFWETAWWRHSAELQERLRAAIQDAAGGRLVRFEATHLTPSGEVRYVDFSLKPITDAEGRVVQLIPEGRDITERKRAEEEVSRLNRELEQRVTERTAQLQAANKDMEAFSYSVSHDLRVPLRAIDGFSRILLEDHWSRLDDEGKRLLGVVRDNTARMAKLIDDILQFSRSGRIEMTVTEFDMEQLVRDVFEDMRTTEPAMPQPEIEPLPRAEADRVLLRQVLINLLSNAIKFSRHRRPPRIQVGGAIKGDEIVYFVKDNGVGFDMRFAGKLFGVFQRLHGVDEFEGTGIGLAIVKRIVDRHCGKVWAESRLDEGATFYFSLPRRTAGSSAMACV